MRLRFNRRTVINSIDPNMNDIPFLNIATDGAVNVGGWVLLIKVIKDIVARNHVDRH
ncbi:hypothetical protein D3C75_468180 [compost metagenome]